MKNLVIICGAGATLNESKATKPIDRPPLDRGFFAQASKKYPSEYRLVHQYLTENYGTDPSSAEFDSLEQMMSILYSDVYNPATSGSNVANAFRSLLTLINSRIAETTNTITPNSNTTLYRIIRDAIVNHDLKPYDITVITFNYDLLIEKTLARLERLAAIKKHGILLSFPDCYMLKTFGNSSSSAKSVSQFERQRVPIKAVDVLKLHGSLNWYSKHTSREPSPNALLNSNRKLWVTARRRIRLDMTTTGKRTMYTFPVVVPPVTNKASILHQSLMPVWKRALEKLSAATNVVVFGYSCPATDQESANLMIRGLRDSSNLETLDIIDPSTSSFQRFADLTHADKIFYYNNSGAYVDGK